MIRFVTGSGFGVGKTTACAVLARADQQAGRRVAYLKPVETGTRPDAPGDSEFVRVAAMVHASECYRFETKLDPAVAAEQAARTISMDWLVDQAQALNGAVDVVYLETTGGLLTPLSEDLTMADLATRLGAEIVVVTRLGLGTLNAAALTLEAIRSRALGVAGFVANRWPPGAGVVERTTLERIGRLGSVLGVLPEVDGLDTAKPSALPDELVLAPFER